MWHKTSSHSRGYGWQWQKLRKRIMQRDCGLCQVCLKNSKTKQADAVDHIVSKANAKKQGWSNERIDDPSNLQAICDDCHDIKTAEEEGKTAKPSITIGSDGWPCTK